MKWLLAIPHYIVLAFLAVAYFVVTFIAFFAALKLGAIVMPLFSGFGPSPIQSRLNHGEAKAVITAGRRKIANRVSPDPEMVTLTPIDAETAVLKPQTAQASAEER